MSTEPRSFPETLSGHILSWLPAKSLVRFRSVSKSWSTLLRSSAFSSAHLRHSSGRSSLLLRHYPVPSSACRIVLLHATATASVFRRTLLTVPSIPAADRFPKIAGSCDGLVCLDFSLSFATHLAVWNPATRHLRPLPVRTIPISPKIWKSAIGFGFDPESGDYKVVRALYFENGDASPKLVIEAFSLRIGRWSVVRALNPVTNWVIQEPGIAVNAMGAVSWIAAGIGSLASCGRFIVCLSLSNYRLRRVILPPPHGAVARRECLKMVGFEKTIGVAVYSNREDSNGGLRLWEYGEGGRWFKRAEIGGFGRMYVPMVVWRGTHVVMLRLGSESCGVFSYDPLTNVSGIVFASAAVAWPVSVFNYVESVVSVHSSENDGDALAETLPLV